MQTNLADFIRDTPAGRVADAILRKCVHCGFCTATCPTYQLLGDELDGPRGRIYQIKEVLEGVPPTRAIQQHLDRCLTCRACETTCPSGVEYAHLLDIGRHEVDARVPRPLAERAKRWALARVLPERKRFAAALRLARLGKGVLPEAMAAKIPAPQEAGPRPAVRHPRRWWRLEGCVQPELKPAIDAAAERVFDRLGISLEAAPGAGCCGAIEWHLDEQERARARARRNIDAWWPAIAAGEVEGILITASGCAAQVRDYGFWLAEDPAYAEKAAQVAQRARDVSEVLAAESAALEALLPVQPTPRGAVAFHAPCSLQHGLKVRGVVERLLARAGYTLVPVREAHLCCGSAGTYSLLQAELAEALKRNKLAALTEHAPARIASANIGCITHLEQGADVPVQHWIELLDEALQE
ncbi:MAG: glycolate oxidase subunit GlcF [Rhodocyclales bacterium]|nr:glycolate oxidase subunit GlcF [Rhodocyclales bacterium]